MLYAILAYFGGSDNAVSSIWNWIPTTVYYGAVMGASVGALALTIVWMFQRDMVYPAAFPAHSRERVSLPSQFGMPHFDDIRLETPDKVVIRGYLIKQATEEETKRAPTLMYFHANAGNMGHRLPIAKLIYDNTKCNVFMLSYRGYGLSDGRPSEAGLRTDALTALEFIRSHPLTANTKLVAYGQSLGGAVAINIVAAHESEFAGLILENTFLSIPKLVPNVLPILKHFTFLASEKWNSEANIQRIAKVPILFLSGLQDELVPPPHMRQLYELATRVGNEKPRVSWEEFSRGNHNDTCVQPNYYERISTWWKEVVDKADPYVPTGRLGTLESRNSVEKSDGENIYRVQSASKSLSDIDDDSANLSTKKDN
ncbi:bem46 protein, variant [Coemansia sp. RSA 989]|nr:Alpha/Beta hydrolase protein [Coemansia mojavensis]KAJ1740049.1 bem46 protein, variant [Coemansia sp. RSA 1086]KAJ1748525.1 bem46 protein, variant [Coemansia sp. RSA 1821]KAJ1862075.1 bem46 protein, variant [Coemansia sp. RSA 989]KAJ1871244.1 bem46 protein, variant [Coemansia sp. RSA 990]KAJ2651191.1 bem46 protein, variant [Coemansia sp. RSA 1250]KAJ2673029.1 bem46 protein, variant [Coemansia sp. RSA 1085]